MEQKPNMKFWGLWNLSFGFFGVQIAYALQSANITRIFATLGANPKSLSWFWILPPLMGILVQPIVGSASDNTWTRWGRRIPYLFVGAAVAVLVMCLLPNAGSLGLTVGAAMIFGVVALMFLDTSINMAMQPFKMLVGDMVNERQKGLAYSIQSFLCNAGSIVGFVFPYVFAWIGISNVAPAGVVPDSVIWSFYIGAAILILCVVYTTLKVREWDPATYARYNPTPEQKEEHASWLTLLKQAPAAFWQVSLVQFFSWAAFLYMWTYTAGTLAQTIWGTTETQSAAYQDAGNWVGICFAVQAIGSVLWAMVLPQFKSAKVAYALSLVLGGIGFALVPFVPELTSALFGGSDALAFLTPQYVLFIPFLLIGCAWAAMLAMPFTFVTNALQGYGHMGTYLGLFNGAICVPQIVAAATGGVVLTLLGSQQSNMMIAAGGFLVLGAFCVGFIKTRTPGE